MNTLVKMEFEFLSEEEISKGERDIFGAKLTEEAKEAMENLSLNPHVLQTTHSKVYKSLLDIKFDRVLEDNALQGEYRRRTGENKTVLHWGQRKLFLSEVEFLTNVTEKDKEYVFVYAGAAPGTHTNFLSNMFPNIKFILIDPVRFTAQETDRISIRQDYFDDETAQEFAGRDDVVFVSDIRGADSEDIPKEKVEELVRKDMESQMRWHNIIKPVASMFKFRLPWDDGNTEYLDGDIYLPVWGPITTTETRLITSSNKTKVYDNKKYESQMFHFNTQTRVARYPHNFLPFYDDDGEKIDPGLDHCYDCTSEIYIIGKYLEKFWGWHVEDPRTTKEIGKVSCEITRQISPDGKRTLVSGNVDPEARKKSMKRRVGR